MDNQVLDDIGELAFRDAAADPTADGRVRRNADTLTVRMQDARTNTTARPFAIQSDTTGTPANSIGVGMRFDAESGDENPSQFGALDFIALDVTAASEDTALGVLLRTAGAALGERFRFQSTGAFLYTITGAPTAARTITLPDSSITLAASAVTLVGSSTTEGTATNTATDLVTVTLTTSLLTTDPFIIIGNVRKSGGAASTYQWGLKLNATITSSARGIFTSADAAKSGTFICVIGPRRTNHLRPGWGRAGGADTGDFNLNPYDAADDPNATITSIAIRGNSDSASVTVGCQDVYVYRLAVA